MWLTHSVFPVPLFILTRMIRWRCGILPLVRRRRWNRVVQPDRLHDLLLEMHHRQVQQGGRRHVRGHHDRRRGILRRADQRRGPGDRGQEPGGGANDGRQHFKVQLEAVGSCVGVVCVFSGGSKSPGDIRRLSNTMNRNSFDSLNCGEVFPVIVFHAAYSKMWWTITSSFPSRLCSSHCPFLDGIYGSQQEKIHDSSVIVYRWSSFSDKASYPWRYSWPPLYVLNWSKKGST